MLVTAGALFVSGSVVLSTVPSTYVARALVGPSAGAYRGPVDRLVDQALSPASLAAVASECDVPRHRTIGEVLTGAPADRLERLGARVDVRGSPAETLVVEARGVTREAALRAADLLAARLVAADAAYRESALPDAARSTAPPSTATSSTSSTPDEPAPSAGPPARVLLEQLRLRHPLLRDPAPERRLQELAQRLSDDRIAIAALEAQLEGLLAEAERLERLVDAEAKQAWRRELAERQAEAARLARAAPAREPVDASTPPAPAAPASRIAELEAELARLLASRTSLHPDVRRLVRLLESERQRVMGAAPPPGQDVRQAAEPPAPSREVTPRHAALPRDDDAPLLVPVADGPPELDGPPVTGPEAWTHRVPSYPAWIQAQHRAEEVQLLVVARREEQAARQREHDLLAQQLAQLREPRLEEARLLERVAAEEAAARRGAPAVQAAASPIPATPLVVLQPAGILAERSPSRHLGRLLAAALLLPLLGGVLLEVRDRSVRGVEDVEDLGVPVLGVVPHLRSRGR